MKKTIYNKKFLVQIGPDTIAVRAKTKRSLERPIQQLSRSQQEARDDSLVYQWKGRRYCRTELRSARVFTMKEFWEAHQI